MACPDPLPTPFDETLRTLGFALGFRPGETVLCMLATSSAPNVEDLVPTLYRLNDLARLTQAKAWAQCFDVRLQGPLLPLERLVGRVRAEDLGPGQRREGFYSLAGGGGFEPADTLTRLLVDQIQQGQRARLLVRTIGHVLTVFDGLDAEPWTDRVRWPTFPIPALRGLVVEQPTSGRFAADKRLAYAAQRSRGVPMLPEHPLIVALEQRELFLAAAQDAPTPPPAMARPGRRL